MVRRAGWVVVLGLAGLAAIAGPAAADWSVGGNLGVSILLPSGGGDNTVLVQVPSGSQLLLSFAQPGLRFGIADAERREELVIETGITSISGGGDTYSSVALMGSFQHAFGSRESGQPYVTAGLGINSLSGGGDSFTRWQFGVGLGHRQFVAGGHGSIRGELRFDRVPEKDENGYTLQAYNVFAMKLGFDLWPGGARTP